MEDIVPINESYHQGDQSRDVAMKTLPNLHSDLNFLFEKQSHPKKDALFAVKLDPAVLEAQVTIGTHRGSCQEGPSNGNATITCKPNVTEFPKNHSLGYTVPKFDYGFERMLSMQREALQSLSSHQFDLLLKYTDTLRKQRVSVQKQMECGFCKNNGQSLEWYSTHSLKDSKGRVRCPVLRSFSCRRCGATGDHAHTIKYCPLEMI